MSIELTTQQRQVVDAPPGNLLISAAAGSGKTSVMTSRITTRILYGDLDVRNILVMTFTNAAAANMREKIEKELVSLANIAEDPAVRRRILEQISYLPLSHISTIHSFCLDVISNFGYDARTNEGEIIIEPGYSVLDTSRKSLLFLESVDEVFSSLYELSYGLSYGNPTGATEETPGQKSGQTAQTGQVGQTAIGTVPNERNRDSREIMPFSILSEDITLEQWLLDFDRMISSLGNPRSDEPVRELIAEFHSYLRSLPFYEDWIREKLFEMRAASVSFEGTKNAQTLMSDFYTAIDLALPNLPVLRGLLTDIVFVKAKKTNDEYKAYMGELLGFFDGLFSEYSKGNLNWDACVSFAGRVPEGRMPSRSKNADPVTAEFFDRMAPLQEVLYSFTGKCKNAVMDLFRTPARHLFARSMKELEEDLAYMFPVAARLYEVLLLVDDRYAQKKRAENAIDFSDYEHLALLLLSKPDAKKYYSALFSEIYIDEYQDNSKIQDAIVASFSRNNCFVVGDVKQSIYRFRHARPELFMDRMRRYRDADEGTLLELNSNFRSRPGILELVNDIFSQILSEESGEIEYDGAHRLNPKRESDIENNITVPTELILIDTSPSVKSLSPEADDTEEESDASFTGDTGKASLSGNENDSGSHGDEGDEDAADLVKTEKEAMVVSYKIQKLFLGQKAAYGDFAVLTRTNREAAIIRDRLILSGIPAEGPSEETFLSNRELLLMENLMRLLDNFRQDIPLAAIMRASFPHAGFLANEILDIYLFARGKEIPADYFHEKVIYYRDNGSDIQLKEKVTAFFDWIDSLRSRSMYLRVSELIEQIYVETGFLEQVVSLPDGGRRVLALETFRDWANNFEKGRNNGLYRFVKYIEDIRSQKQSPEDFEIAASERDVVHCMSIHKSKGLEFKYVFLTGIHSSLSGGHTRRHVLMSEKLGIGMDYIRPDSGYWYPTHQKLALETEEYRAQLAEYMRVFYVAMTRAEERLFLIGCISRNKDTSLGKSSTLLRYAHNEKQEKLPSWLVFKAKSYLDFCLLGLARNRNLPMEQLLSEGEKFPDVPDVLKEAGNGRTKAISLSVLEEKEVLKSYFISPDEAGTVPGAALQEEEKTRITSPSQILQPLSAWDTELFEKQISGVYPFEMLTAMPAKMTVSEIKRQVGDYARQEEEGEEGAVLLPAAASEKRPVNLVPQPIEAQRERKKLTMSPAEKGTLLHSVFQYLDFPSIREDKDAQRIEKAMGNLAAHNMIHAGMQAELENYYPAIDRFAASDLCGRLISAEKQKGRGPFREIPFSITMPVGETDVSLVQGMIDCWFIEDGSAVLIDYKSDTIAGTQTDKARILDARYSVQLGYYAKAIEAASGLKVKERIIWLIPDGLSFSIEAPGKTL